MSHWRPAKVKSFLTLPHLFIDYSLLLWQRACFAYYWYSIALIQGFANDIAMCILEKL
jgi:hypothetical protein